MVTQLKAFSDYSCQILHGEQTIVQVKKEAILRIALVFPNSYAVGMSNLGFQEVYRLLNSHESVSCERLFIYDPPFDTMPLTLEFGRKLTDFDVIAFSVSFEPDFPNLLRILQHTRIPYLSANRRQWDPLVLCGGVITMLNPTPLAPFIDVFLLGEAQPLLNDFIEIIHEHKPGGLRENDCLAALASHPSFWVPGVNDQNEQAKHIKRDARQTPIQSCVISSRSHFKNMHLVEVGRACSRGCRFCAAGFVYQPTHFFTTKSILAAAQNNPFGTKKIGLVGSALSDFPRLTHLCQQLAQNRFQLGLSSFRPDMISAPFLKILEQAGVKSLTFAVEAGSEELRNIIHKQLSNEQIFSAVEALNSVHIILIKFYFMIGLPFEKQTDLDAVVNLMQTIHKMFTRTISISVSINAFIPKPKTPFQWFALDSEKQIKQKRQYLTRELKKIPGVSVVPKSTKTEILQALFSLGDSELLPLFTDFMERDSNWNRILKKHWKKVQKTVFEKKAFNQYLPWDFIVSHIQKATLIKIAGKAEASGKDEVR